MDDVVFKTMHGSHLYGLNHEDSDQDFYTVVWRGDRGKRYKFAKQDIVNGVDNVTVDYHTWLGLCAKGVPQALEAMFSPVPEIDKLPFFRQAYHVGISNMRETYYRTMENFVKANDIKRKRHALRLYLNYRDASRYGWFNPRLTEHQVWWVTQVAERMSDSTVLRFVLTERLWDATLVGDVSPYGRD